MVQTLLQRKALVVLALLSLALLASECATTHYADTKAQEVFTALSSRVDALEQDQHALRAEVGGVKQTAQAGLTQSQQLAHADILPKTATNRDVPFAFDDHRLTPQGKATLDALAADLAQQPYEYIQIIRHADAVGPETYNLALARRRVETVAAYLAQQPTVNREKLRVLSLGVAVPVAETTTRDGRAHNRCVEVLVYRLHWQ
jgi:outer membrane protein OmpA-like peptidoglycan-associated protein